MSQKNNEKVEDGIILILDTLLTILKNYKKLRKVLQKKINKSKPTI